ncbi:MAG: transglutaminase family protein, partial [Actinomycetota bacterium]|nr:transglutaminase family protein [Actinomycetota bacterium]
DSVDLHAWAEAYIPGAGWVGLDPTSGLLTGEGHIPLASTSLPAAAMPITGTAESPQTSFEYSGVVRRIHQAVQVTLPYTAEQWERIDALGHKVDAALKAADARLTMGGEPTFVSAKDIEKPEWNTAAVGGTKEALAWSLAERLAHDFAPGALLLHGQGKWYPGEPLPRWQIGVYWRADGHPLWRDPGLLADPTTPGSATEADAAGIVTALADALGLPEEVRYRAYEDPVGRLWSEARLPGGDPPTVSGPDPSGAGLALPEARAAIIAGLDAERGRPRGWALPLHRAPGDPGWSTGRWCLRRGHLFLISGDSPIGLRLPLDALTWTPPPGDPLLSLFRTVSDLPAEPPGGKATAVAPAKMQEPPPITSLCVQLGDGHVHVFLPPIADYGHAVELIGLIEDVVATAGIQVVIEGYPPPVDTRGRHFVVAPDPGVIEVNIHPSASWPELSDRTRTIDDEARALGLVTEKFRLDGTHTGTGGGSHLTLGGPTPADSPLLRRPDLLRSLLTYWQHHPSLSYLFSGRFVGPTSQSPRIDEGRHESLYELEIAFAELERLSAEGPAPPWQVDRLFRHLLTDLTGNTHRAEFCIDKLFDPATDHGRLGVLELRGFEMPPHPQMALLQSLLVRALVARFWAEPYAAPLVRWGTELHDRFLLPWWLALDIRSVLADLDRHGFAFEDAWLEPFLEFRFPLLGAVSVEGVSLELRTAIEPWNVLGEEAAATTSRFVDSSLERLEVRLDGATDSRYGVTCNGFPVPIQPTDTPGTYVGGVRYRAWQPPSTLHPTIGVHTPLVFDIVDRWSSRSIGGCTYHVVHPGGVAYKRLPSGAKDAEARRASRFEPTGHTPGRIEVADIRREGEYPRTLDLRRVREPPTGNEAAADSP